MWGDSTIFVVFLFYDFFSMCFFVCALWLDELSKFEARSRVFLQRSFMSINETNWLWIFMKRWTGFCLIIMLVGCWAAVYVCIYALPNRCLQEKNSTALRMTKLVISSQTRRLGYWRVNGETCYFQFWRTLFIKKKRWREKHTRVEEVK